ncbi:hypothetical protein PROFUN_01119 [Planoprotostelium fungivorum]|uniref:Uncharacterized protein n=1 Tax=Planoprotostelium fungivorum TaxID=1890364 RepID=A0A2P6NCF5_9EUKA|nr:hypothetical protein PROFUN_01119 [Planoprotostelium fungivorum]
MIQGRVRAQHPNDPNNAEAESYSVIENLTDVGLNPTPEETHEMRAGLLSTTHRRPRTEQNPKEATKLALRCGWDWDSS